MTFLEAASGIPNLHFSAPRTRAVRRQRRGPSLMKGWCWCCTQECTARSCCAAIGRRRTHSGSSGSTHSCRDGQHSTPTQGRASHERRAVTDPTARPQCSECLSRGGTVRMASLHACSSGSPPYDTSHTQYTPGSRECLQGASCLVVYRREPPPIASEITWRPYVVPSRATYS